MDAEDKGDYYLHEGRRIGLLRARAEVAVQYKDSVSAEQGFNALESNPALAGKVQRKKTLRSTGIDIIQEIPVKGGAKMTASKLQQYISMQPEVAQTYPVLVNPGDNQRVVAFNEILLCLEDTADINALSDLLSGMSASVAHRTDAKDIKVYLITLLEPSVYDALSSSVTMNGWPGVKWAEPNFLTEIQFSFTPNDPQYNQQQSLHNTGRNGGLADADVDAPDAWDITRGLNEIVVAIIDDGVDVSHPDLRIQPGEYDFANNDANASPVGYNGHGTGCAGIVAATGNNNYLISGIAPECSILPVKIADDDGMFSTDENIGNAIRYAADRADILSNSWGGGPYSSYISSAISYAVSTGRDGLGSPVFFATGNSASIWYQGGGRVRLPTEGLSGAYYFSFYYEKDESYSEGLDAALIDNVALIDADGYTHLWREDFEGTFPPSGWTVSGNADWRQTTSNVFTGTGGTKSAKSGAITHNQWTRLTTPLQTITGDETLAFAYAISSEWGFDNFYFEIYDSSQNLVVYYGPGSGVPYMVTAPSYPASDTNSIAVGAATDRDRRSDYSQYGSNLDFVAPSNGGWNDITALDPLGSVGWNDTDFKSGFGGTSSACPLAAGIAALLLSMDPTYTAAEVRSVMRRSCDKIGGLSYSGGEADAGGRNDQYGYGRINAYAMLKNLYTDPPVITLNGMNEVTIECGATYVEAGAVAEDMFHYNLTSSIVVVNPVDTLVPGTYVVRYNVSDRASNPAVEVTRTIYVVDTTAPVITLLGTASVSIECGTDYLDAGAIAADICAGNLTASLAVTDLVNSFMPGSYAVYYNVNDPSSNAAAEVMRTVTVIDTVAPVISLHGDPALTLRLCPDDTIPTIPGASAVDACAGNLAANIVVGGDSISTTPGTYTITYDVVDASFNAAEQATRTITVEVPVGPNIFVDSVGQTLECGDPFDPPTGYVRNDCDNTIVEAAVEGSVDIGLPGSYTLTYSYPEADPVQAVVTVQDTIPPVITLRGESEIMLQSGDEYTDAGAVATDVCDGDLTEDIVISGNEVNTFVPGAYVAKYNVSDGVGNRAGEVVRRVTVLDTQPLVTTVLVETENTVLVTFSKRMGEEVLEESKYSISGAGVGSLQENPASVEYVDSNTYRLVWGDCAGIMHDGSDITVTVASDMQDIVGNQMAVPAFGTHAGGGYSPLPVITLLGTNPTAVECGLVYIDEGATAADACGGDLTAAITVANPVDVMVLGAYTVRYNVVDAGANAAVEVTRVVQVEDTTPPSISRTGSTTLTLECGSAYVFPDVVAEDACEGLYDSVQVSLGTGEAGLTAWFWALDNNYAPLWNGDEPVRYAYNQLPEGTGNYLLIYWAAFSSGATYPVLENGLPPLFDDSGLPDFLDEQGNVKVDFARLVKVVDSQSPFITMEGDREITLTCNTPYVEPGVRATDFCEGDITANIVVEGVVNPDVAGTYTLTYRIMDQAGRSGANMRTVHVIENLLPIITLTGSTALTLECGTAFADPGVAASDDCDGDLTDSIIVGGDDVELAMPGVYERTYDVSDIAGNAAVQQIRTVTVADTTLPVITLSGDREMRIPYGGKFSDPGATVWDACDGDLTQEMEVTSEVIDTQVPGNYRIEYDVVDKSGNESTVIRQILVLNPKTVLVPNIVGMKPDEAQAALSSLLLQMEISEEEYHPTIPAGQIIRQTPMSGSSVQEGSFITVAVSKGPEPLEEGEPTEGEPGTLEEIAGVLLEQFDTLDAGDEGRATYEQAQTILPGLTEQQFSDIDKDGDGYISREELLAVIEGDVEECTGCRVCLGCCKSENKALQRYLGDWLLVGLSMLALGRFRR